MLRETLGHYFDVIIVLAEKDFKVKYRNSVLGFIWSLLSPLAYMLILTLVFALLYHVSIPNFAAWVLLGILIWRFFSVGTNQGLFSIVGNPSLVSKVYLPRYIIVISNNVANLLGAILEFLALLPLLVLLGVNLTIYSLFLPAILVLEFLLVFGLSLSLASLNLKYRDFYQLWDIALQLGFWLSPIVYDLSIIPPRYQTAYLFNPVTRLIVSTREIFLSNQLPSLVDMGVIVSSVLVFLGIGVIVFRKLEPRFAEDV
jgi:lipopolysaccharide transport system permease protein